MARDIEKFKSNQELELERFRSELQNSALEHQIRYQSLHVKRAEVIAEIYGLVTQAQEDIISLIKPYELDGEPSQDEKSKQAFKSVKELYDYYKKKKIYFKQETCERIDNFIQVLSNSRLKFNFILEAQAHRMDHMKIIEQWQTEWEKLTKELPLIKAELEEEFREILGL